MDKHILIITYAVSDELDETEVIRSINENKKKWFKSKLGFFDRLKVRLNRRFFENEVILVETGIGKVNSYSELYTILEGACEYTGQNVHLYVLNLGTAASMNLGIGEVVECGRFIDRDLIRLGYGYKGDYTIYTIDGKPRFLSEMEDRIDELDGADKYIFGYSCNSGDSFVTDPEEAYQMRDGWTAVCDMEGFAQARAVADASNMFNHPIKFRCIKYITDKIGEDNSIEGWQEELPAARAMLTQTAKDAIKSFYSKKPKKL